MQLTTLFVATVVVAVVAVPVFAQDSDQAASAQSSAASSKKAAHKQNWQTENAVRKAMTSTKGLDSASIRIVARDGVLTLDGTVPDQSQIPMAQNAAQSVPQVKSVSNRLTVKEAGN